MKKRIRLVALFCSLMMGVMAGVSCKNKGNGDNSQTPESSSAEVVKPSLTLGTTQLDMYVGDSVTLNYALRGIEEDIVFDSSNKDVATIDENGMVHAVGCGDAVISLTVAGISKTCFVKVQAVPTYALYCSDGDVLLILDRTYQLNAELRKGSVLQEDAVIEYSSLENTVATVDNNGLITAVGVGKATIEMVCNYQEKTYKTSIEVTVNKSLWIEVEKTAIVEVGSSVTLDYKVKDFSNNVVNEVATLVAHDGKVSVSGNQITGVSRGNAKVSVQCGGIVVDVDVMVFSNVYNDFADNSAIGNSHGAQYTTEKATVPFALTNQNPATGATENFNMLVCSSTYVEPISATQTVAKSFGMYVQGGATLEELYALKNAGYRFLTVEYLIESQVEKKIFIVGLRQILKPGTTSVKYTNTIAAANYNKWYKFNITIDDLITLGEDVMQGRVRLLGVEINNTMDAAFESKNTNVYIKPMYFTK